MNVPDTSVTGYRYMIHFYCLAVEAGFYSDVVECLPVDPAHWVRFPAGTGKIFSLYDNGAPRWVPICRRVWIREPVISTTDVVIDLFYR